MLVRAKFGCFFLYITRAVWIELGFVHFGRSFRGLDVVEVIRAEIVFGKIVRTD